MNVKEYLASSSNPINRLEPLSTRTTSHLAPEGKKESKKELKSLRKQLVKLQQAFIRAKANTKSLSYSTGHGQRRQRRHYSRYLRWG